MKKFNIIVAYDKNRGIGYKNDLPWPKLKKDMARFVKVTTETSNKNKINAVIMGRNTWDSIPVKFRPFKNRLNIILSNNPKIKEYETNDMIKVFNSFELAHKYADMDNNIENIFVIGGDQVYNNVINNNNINKIFATEIDLECTCDKFFPNIDSNKYTIIENSNIEDVNETKMIFKTFVNNDNLDNFSEEYQYINLIKDIIINGEKKDGRNGITYSMFGPQHSFDLQKGFPLLTTKKMFFKGIIEELIFFINGFTDSNILREKGVNIWTPNTTREFLDNRGMFDKKIGDMGPMYGWNWRHFGAQYNGCDSEKYKNQGYDQLYYLIDGLINDPHGRRHLLTTYDPSKVNQSVLAPCHGLIVQFNVRNKEYLDCKMYQRSVDVGLGYPFNIASYALFVHIICYVTGYKPGKLVMTLGDTHIYEQHIDQLKMQIDRIPLKFPKLEINKEFNVKETCINDKLKFMEELIYDDIKLIDYMSYPLIKMDMVA